MRHQVVTQIANQLKSQMKISGKGWLTIRRRDLTDLVRVHSGNASAKLGKQVARELEDALAAQGILVIPGLESKEEYVRLVWAGTMVGQLQDMLAHPGPEGDVRLAHIITKIKGRWEEGREAA